MCFGLFVVQLDLTIVNVAVPRISAALGAGVSGLQWVVDGYALTFAGLLLSGGGLADRYGRRRIFLLGLAIFGAGSAACGLGGSLGIVVAGRLVQGVGAALELPASLAIVSVTFDDAGERAQAMGLWASIGGLSLIVGPLLGGALVDMFGWQSVFLVNVPVVAVAAALTLLAVPESSDPDARGADLLGQALSVAALGAAVFGVIEGSTLGWGSPAIVGALVLAGAAAIGFVAFERRRRHPLVEVTYFRDPTFAAANIVGALMVFAIYGMLFLLTLFLQNVKGASASGAGLWLVPIFGSFIAATPFGGRLTARVGYRLPMAAGMGMSGAGLLLLATVDAGTRFAVLVVPMVLIGLGLALATPALVAAAIDAVPRTRAGMASGVLYASRQTGGAVGVAVLGAIASARLTVTLTDALARLELPVSTRVAVLEAARGGRLDPHLLPPGVDQRGMAALVSHALVAGMHAGFVVGGLALLVASGMAVALAGRGAPASARADDDTPLVAVGGPPIQRDEL